MSTPFTDDLESGDVIEADHVNQFGQPVNDLEDGKTWYREATNTGNAYKVNFASGNVITAYTKGMIINVRAAADNTGAATLTITGPSGDLAAIDLKKRGGDALEAGDINAGQILAIIYTEDAGATNKRFEVLGGLAGGLSASTTVAISQGGTGATSASAARSNLGAQAQDSALDEIAALSMAKGDVFVHNGTAVTKLGPGSNGQVLSADSAESTGLKWVAQSIPANDLDDLTDVVISSPATGQTLRYNGTNFVNAAMGIADVTDLQDGLDDKQDLSAKGAANGYAGLDATGKVPTAQLPAFAADLDDLSDVVIASPDTGQVLMHNGTNFVNVAISLADVADLEDELDEKEDVSQKGQAGGYPSLDGAGKVPNAQLTGVLDLDDLSDVVIASPAAGEVVRHNGTNFVNAVLAISDVTDLQDELDAKQASSEKGQADGYASLDGAGKVPNAQLVEVLALNNLSDVIIASPGAGEVIRHNGTNFVNAVLAISDVTDLQDELDAKQASSEKGQADGYASLDGAGKVPNAQLVEVLALNDLSDVTIDTPLAAQVVRYDGTEFVNEALVISDVTDLQDELDAKQASSEKGQAGGYASLDGGALVPKAQLLEVLALTDLSDVTIDTPLTAQVVRYDGVEFVNAPLAISDVTDLQDELDDKSDVGHTHPASDIVSGNLALARGGTGADLSATGGTAQFLKQTSSGGVVSVEALAASEMPSGIDAAKIGAGSVSDAEFGYLDGVTSAIQTQIDGKAPTSHTHAASEIVSGSLALARGGTGSDLSATGGTGQFLKQTSSGGVVSVAALTATEMPTGIDAAKIGGGSVSNTEFGYLDGVTSAIQTQINGKAATSHSHSAADITSGTLVLARGGTGANLSATGGTGQVLKQTSSGGNVSVGALTASEMPSGIDAAKIGGGAVSNTEFGYLNSVTSAIQTQLNAKADDSHTHSTSDITSGTLGVARGGTGLASFASAGRILYSSSTSAITSLGTGSSGYVLMSTGSGPQWNSPSALDFGSSNVNCGNVIADSIPIYSSSGAVLYAYASGGSKGMHHHWSSSRRFKTDIRSMEKVKDRLSLLEPVRYKGTAPAVDANGDLERDESGQVQLEYKDSFGLIAEDVAELFPDLVFDFALEDGTTSYAIHYDRLPIYQIQALKEQQAEIDELKARLAALEGAR